MGTFDSEGKGAEGEGQAGAGGSKSSKGICLIRPLRAHRNFTRAHLRIHSGPEGSLSVLHPPSPVLKADPLRYRSHAVHMSSHVATDPDAKKTGTMKVANGQTEATS